MSLTTLHTDTPRTDTLYSAWEAFAHTGDVRPDIGPYDLARQLERERNDLLAALELINAREDWTIADIRLHARAAIARATKEQP